MGKKWQDKNDVGIIFAVSCPSCAQLKGGSILDFLALSLPCVREVKILSDLPIHCLTAFSSPGHSD